MIPTQYNSLPGFRTVYSETELVQAIANSEVMVANGQGGGGIEVATREDQIVQSGLLTTISNILERPIIHLTGTTTTGLATPILTGQLNNRIFLTEISFGNLSTGPVTVALLDSLSNVIVSTRLLDGGNLVKMYPAGREFRVDAGNGLAVRATINTTYCVGYVIVPT